MLKNLFCVDEGKKFFPNELVSDRKIIPIDSFLIFRDVNRPQGRNQIFDKRHISADHAINCLSCFLKKKKAAEEATEGKSRSKLLSRKYQ